MTTSDPQLYAAVGRLEGKIDVLLSNQSRFDKRLDDQDNRITALETNQTKQGGILQGAHLIAAGIASVVAFVLPYLKGFIGL